MSRFSKYFAVAKVNFRRGTFPAYIAAGALLALFSVDLARDLVRRAISPIYVSGDSSVGLYCALYLVCAMAPIFMASGNFSKFMNIGVKKMAYFYGCIINYVIYAAAASLAGTLEHFLLDSVINAEVSGRSAYHIIGFISAFGWDGSVFEAFFSQFAFLLMIEAIVHTLTFMQTKWYGIAADCLILVLICVFIPVEPLRTVWEVFFYCTLYARPVFRIACCLMLAALSYATNLFYLRRRSY